MQSGGQQRSFFTSLAGISPLTDVLADLPLPSHHSTSMEQAVAGKSALTFEALKILSNADLALGMQVANALSSIDCSFLKLNKPCLWQPYIVNENCPPLIQTFINNQLFQPAIKLKKLSLTHLQSVEKAESLISVKSYGTDLIAQDAQPQPSTMADSRLTKSHTKRKKARDGDHQPGAVLKKSKLLSSETGKNRKSVKPQALVVSIERMAVGKLPAQMPKSQGHFNVKIPRVKLTGSFGTVEHLSNFCERTIESTAANEQRKVKTRKPAVLDHTLENNIKRFTDLLASVFDCEDHANGDSISRVHVSQIATEVAKLKQQMILNRVPVDDLVKLIALMDKQVLDSAALQLNVAPDEADCEAPMWRELTKERILRSFDACLVILHITTAPNMPQKVHLEEAIEQLIAVTKFHLEANVYPEFDPVYRAESKETGIVIKQKRRYAGVNANKDVVAIYHKLVEVVENLALLVEAQPLTDAIVLQISSLGVSSFFVENISALQLSALRLSRAVFSRYETHRDLIMEDIFVSLARLPTSKRNLRTFRLASSECIQMVTALILQLVQCIVAPPSIVPSLEEMGYQDSKTHKQVQADVDVHMINSYELALRTGKNFLSTFMRKCCTVKDEDDFRPLFENFVADLLTTLNLPEWPAAEVLLTLLGMLLVHAFTNRSNEMSLRLIALDHLGVIAARLRRDAIISMEQDHDELVNILAQILQSKLEMEPLRTTSTRVMDAFSENTQHFQKALIAYLSKKCAIDPACGYARDFYLGQWLRDSQQEMERVLTGSSSQPEFPIEPIIAETSSAPTSNKAAAMQDAEQRNEVLHQLIQRTEADLKHLENVLDAKGASTVSRFLGSFRALSKSFSTYLQQLLRVLNEPAVHVRSRAMKALSTIVTADPSLLSRVDLQRGVHSRFLDQSTLVREAAVDLVGRFVLSCPDLASQYYEMLGERILDTGVSVRKRVIKILKDICVSQPDFSKADEVCVKIMKRINDEEGIKQLVTTVFQQLWFAPPEGTNKRDVLLRRAKNITNVVDACKESECFEQLLEQLFKIEDSALKKSMLDVSQMLVDTLVENVLTLDETAASNQNTASVGLVACITTLYIFCKVRPNLLLKHATTLHPYLSSKCSTQNDMLVVSHVAHILEQVVPRIEHPSESFMRDLEEDLVKLIMKHGQMIVQSCVLCLGAVVNNVTHNYGLVKETFMKFFVHLEKVHAFQVQDPQNPQMTQLKATVLRSVFTVGLLCKSFDFDKICCRPEETISNRIHTLLVAFARNNDEETQLKAVTGLGFFYLRYPELMHEHEPKLIYQEWLGPMSSIKKKCQVLKNLQNYFKEVEAKLKVDSEALKKKDPGNLLEFGDHHSSVSSNVAQAFLSSVLEASMNTDTAVRMSSLHVVVLILRQGLVHPAQCVPYLIVMSGDPETAIRIKAEQQLTEHSSKYGQIMQSQLLAGVKKSYTFLQLISCELVRGCTDHPTAPQSVLSHIYTLVRANKQHRRAFLKALIRYFEEYEKTGLQMLLFLSDNLAYFPYATLEEPLFVVHHIDMTLSVTGSALLQAFNESIWGNKEISDETDNIQTLMAKECNLNQLAQCCYSSYGCFLLLVLKRYLQRSYGLSDSKCQKYSPNESNKTYEKAVTKKTGVMFEPSLILDVLKDASLGNRQNKTKEDYLKIFIEFKQMMNKLDPFDAEDELSDHETATTSAMATHSNEPPAEDLNKDVKSGFNIPQKSAQSRTPSTSSNGSTGQRKSKNSKARRQRFISSDGSDNDDPDFK